MSHVVDQFGNHGASPCVIEFRRFFLSKPRPLSRLLPPLALFLTLTALFPAAGRAASGAPELSWRKAGEAPHDETAFTQGLLLLDGKLYESTGLYGHSELRRIDPATGAALERQVLPARLFGEGLAASGGVLYQLTWKENTVRKYSAATLAPLGELPQGGEGWGLAFDGRDFIRSDGSNRLYFHSPATFAPVRTIEVTDNGAPVDRLNALAFVRGMILANIWYSDKIAVISPAGGKVLGWLDMTALRPASCPPGSEKVFNGIAYDPGSGWLYLTGKLWPRLFVVEVDWRGLASPDRPNPALKDAQ
ncbi:MAG: glutaminyl-peptide cyclotransferase [Desulfovibrionaceae bacterium]|nr:glutaminyl-peptide cyclotransferase [Desulfovibrionaceae bacterium]MBF0513076.1 glutaminyl-peptide cyclotransferase [Desulfovibrionaceae bacterium]